LVRIAYVVYRMSLEEFIGHEKGQNAEKGLKNGQKSTFFGHPERSKTGLTRKKHFFCPACLPREK